MGRLFVVATPIGNLQDLSPRALRVLGEVSLVAAEDTRVARSLLAAFGLRARLLSYNEHNRGARIPVLLRQLESGDVALVSDAGTPGVSDPGAELVAAARAAGHEVVAMPGPSALVAALSIAGIACSRFCFLGFLPRASGELRRLLAEAAAGGPAIVAFEAPQRLPATLAVIAEVASERRLAVCRELTKLHEEVFFGTAEEALAHFQEVRGEIVLVIEGAPAPARQPAAAAAGDIAAAVAEMRRQGLTRAQATALCATLFGAGRRRVYELWLETESAGAVATRTTAGRRRRGTSRS